MFNERIVLIGGKGKSGRRVMERLEAKNAGFRSASRSGDVRFDWDDESSWKSALQQTEIAYITYSPDLAFPGVAEKVKKLVQLAVNQGVRRLVLLSGRNEAGALACEEAVRHSGASWTIIRASWFNQNFTEGFFAESIRAGEVAFVADQVSEPFIDLDDIADVVTAALLDESYAGKVYEVTGPRLMRFADAVAEIGQACGRKIHYVPVSTDEYREAMIASGLELDFANNLMNLFAEVLDGRSSYLTDGIQAALGREPLDFRQFARTAWENGAW